MKKFISSLLFIIAAAVLTACTPSEIKNEETQFIPEGAVIQQQTTSGWKVPETKKYVIPDDAETGENGGPGAMATTAVDYSMYPEDKRPVAAEAGDENTTLIIIYRQTDLGLEQDFDAVDVCDAASLIASMTKNGAFKDGTEVESFTVDGDGVGTLELNKLDIYGSRNMEIVVAGIANTFIDNLGLKAINIKIGDQDFGKLEFSYEYDA